MQMFVGQRMRMPLKITFQLKLTINQGRGNRTTLQTMIDLKLSLLGEVGTRAGEFVVE